jgi:hypothetical protein
LFQGRRRAIEVVVDPPHAGVHKTHKRIA